MMPFINLELLEQNLLPEDFELVKGIVATRGKNKGQLRASKPSLPKKIKVPNPNENSLFPYSWGYADEVGNKAGKTAYLWRQVVFFISPIPAHQCIPTFDFCDLPVLPKEELQELEDYLHKLADKVVDTVPLGEQHGVLRWAA